MYLDATAAIPHVNLENDNDSSGSHPLDTQVVPVSTPQLPQHVGNLTNGDAHENEKEVEAEKNYGSANNPSFNNEINTTFGGCTPGLRRRRQGTDKYATDTNQLGLRFQRRRRHMAGNHDTSIDEDKSASPGLVNGILPLGEGEAEIHPLTIFT